MEKSAKELCALLMTKGIKALDDDQEEIVYDYLYDHLGIEMDADTNERDLCQALLSKTIPPPPANLPRHAMAGYQNRYYNSLLEGESVARDAKQKQIQARNLLRQRKDNEERLKNMDGRLPGCVKDQGNNLKAGVYDLVVDANLGIAHLTDGSTQYTAVVSIPSSVYQQILYNVENPTLQINTTTGYKGFAKIADFHSGPNNLLYISPLIARMLNVDQVGKAILNLCTSMPILSKVDFTYYGTQADLDQILPQLIVKLPSVINAFAYLSLGMVLQTEINGELVSVRVDGLEDNAEKVFAGLLAAGESDLPFDVVPSN